MEITIKIDGQAFPVEVSFEIYTYLDQAGHKDDNLAHEQRRQRFFLYALEGMINRSLEQNGIKERVDHRSYKQQGIDKTPSVHMGVADAQMERRGIPTDKGNINREITAQNKILKEIKAKLHGSMTGLRRTANNPEKQAFWNCSNSRHRTNPPQPMAK